MLTSIKRRWKRNISFNVLKFSDDKINDLSFQQCETNRRIVNLIFWTL